LAKGERKNAPELKNELRALQSVNDVGTLQQGERNLVATPSQQRAASYNKSNNLPPQQTTTPESSAFYRGEYSCLKVRRCLEPQSKQQDLPALAKP